MKVQIAENQTGGNSNLEMRREAGQWLRAKREALGPLPKGPCSQTGYGLLHLSLRLSQAEGVSQLRDLSSGRMLYKSV